MINVYKGPKEGYTVMKLTDGSTIGGVGDLEGNLHSAMIQQGVLTVNNADGSKIFINPNHIVYARYTEPKEDNDG